jgi:uncharacterized membrane protein
MSAINTDFQIQPSRAVSRYDDRVLSKVALVAGILVFTAYFMILQLQKHNSFQGGLDILTIEQPLWNSLHGDFMRATYYPVSGTIVSDFHDRATVSLFGDHFQPSLLALLPLYALVPRSETLFFVQCLVIALGAIPLYRITLRRSSLPWVAVLFSLMYLIIPAVQTLSAGDIHATIFVPPLFLAAFNAMERKKWIWFYIFMALAFGLREDLPVLLGWAILFMAPKAHRRRMLILFGAGILWTCTSFLWIIPSFGSGSTPYLARYFPLGTEISLEGMLPVLMNPRFWWIDLRNFFFYNVRLGIPLLFIYFWSPRSLLAALPVLSMNGASWWHMAQFPNQFHYSAPVVATIFIGAVDGFLVFTSWLRKLRPGYNSAGVTSVALATSIVMANILTGYTPISLNFSWPSVTGREPAIQELLDNIPENAVVSAEENLAVHLARRETIRIFPDIRDAEYVLVDTWFGDYPFYLDLNETTQVFRDLASSPEWTNAGSRAGVIVLQRGSGPPQDLNGALHPISRQPMYSIQADFSRIGDSISLVGIDIFDKDSLKPVICTWWDLPQQTGASYPVIDLLSPKGSQPYTEVFSQDFLPEGYPIQGKVTLCSRYYIDNKLSEDILRVTVENSEGERSSITMKSPGDFLGSLEVSDTGLLIHFKPGPGNE